MGARGLTTRIAALDGVRAVAVLSVFAYHALASEPDFSGLAVLQLGRFGVTVFFVLSGFLITSRLLSLEARRDLAAGARWRSFLVRRAARIFPLYYATVAFVVLSGTSRSAWPWLVTYSLNFGVARSILEHGRWIGPGHLWSLCVEEQFYLLFPALVLTRLRRWLVPIVGAAAVAAVALRISVAMTGSPWGVNAVWMLPPAHFDALGAGILAALVAERRSVLVRRGTRFHELGLVLGALATIGLGIVATRSPWPHVIGLQDQVGMLSTAVFPAALSAASAAAILAAWRGELGSVGRVLGSGPFVAVGRISYGIYVFHLLVLSYFTHHAWHPTRPLTRALLALAATIALAGASWRILERPLIEGGRRLAEALELRSAARAPRREP
jgi:peptidoglycan/LPS O-acetylase OafA/YrhL